MFLHREMGSSGGGVGGAGGPGRTATVGHWGWVGGSVKWALPWGLVGAPAGCCMGLVQGAGYSPGCSLCARSCSAMHPTALCLLWPRPPRATPRAKSTLNPWPSPA